ncbi:MAG: DUF6580 family putative transport protein [Bacteroidales bacterium]
MENKKINLRFGAISCMILLAALSRLIPHPINFAPISGIALFGAAFYGKKYWAFIIPIVSMWISDLIINNVVYAELFDGFVWFYSGSLFTYAAFVAIAILGMNALKRVTVSRVVASAMSASILFFALSNFGVWLSSGMYPHTWNGLATCYAAGLPFLKNTVAGDLVYSALLFGAFVWGESRFPALRPVSQSIAS